MTLRAGNVSTRNAASPEELCAEITRLRERIHQLETLSTGAVTVGSEETRLNDFAESLDGWFWEMDAELRFTYFSPSVERVTGISPQWHYGKTRDGIGIPESVSEDDWRAHMETLRRREPFRNFTYQRLGPHGATWLQVSGVPVYDAAGAFTGYRGVATDVSKQVEAERRNRQLLSAVANLDEVFVLWDAEDRLIAASSKFHEINEQIAEWNLPGTPFEAHVSAAIDAGLYPDAVGRERQCLAERCERHRQAGAAFEMMRPDGRCLLVKEHHLPDGCTATIGVDITERKKTEAEIRETRDRLRAESEARASAEQALRDSEARYRVLVEHAPEVVCVIDVATGLFVDANQNATQLFNRDRAALLSTGPLALSAPLQQDNVPADEAIAAQLQRAARGEHPIFEWWYQDPQDRIIPCEVRLSLLPDVERTLVRGSIIDITERKEIQRRREWQSRLNDSVRHAQTLFIEIRDTEKSFAVLLEGLLASTESEYGFIGEVLYQGPQTPYLKTHSITNISWDDDTRRFYDENAPAGLEFHNLDTLFGAVLKSGDAVIANSPATDPRAGGLPPGHPVMHAFLGLPLFAGGRLVGAAGVANRRGGYDAALVNELQPFLTSCGSLLQAHRERVTRAEAEAELARHRDDLERQVLARTARLATANQEIKRFSYIVSHDLRAPLVNIKGFVGELRADLERLREVFDDLTPDLDETRLREVSQLFGESIPEATGFIDASVTRMDRQIQALLHYARIGERTFSPRPLNLEVLIDGCIGSIRHQIDACGAEVHVESMPELVSDALAVEQIIGNLLENAVKFLDPERPGKISVSGERVVGGVSLRVTDNGCGIAEQDVERVFHACIRAAPRHIPGEGMGLAFVEALVTRLGGYVTCESQVGEGTTICVMLPDATP